MPLPVYLTVESSFASAHFLPGYVGKCKNMHGHLWRIVVEFGPYDTRDGVGIAVDFHDLKNFVRDLCEELDHRLLNDIISKPTAENIVEWFHDQIPHLALNKIELWESPTSSCIWRAQC